MKLITIDAATDVTLTIPTDASMTWPIGMRVDVLQLGVGRVLVEAATPGTTAVNPDAPITRAPYSACSLQKLAANRWVVVGDLA